MPTKSGERLRWITQLRALATLAVVMVHVSAAYIVYGRPIGGLSWWAGNLVDSASRWCVPVFVMISGALLLDPARPLSATEFYRRRARRIGVPLLVWSCVYFAYRALDGEPMSTRVIVRDLLAGVPYFHLWYLYMVIGLFAVTPLLRVWVARTGRSRRWWTIALLFGAASVHNWAAIHDRLPAADTIVTLFLPYLGYYLCGFQLREVPPRMSPTRTMAMLAGVGAVALAVIALGTRLIFRPDAVKAGLYLYEYLCAPVIVLSLAVFLFARAIDARRASAADGAVDRTLANLSGASLGIYVIHPLFLELLDAVGIDFRFGPPVLGLLLRGGLAISLSWMSVSLMGRVPVLRRAVQS